jgi:DNA-binding MarR family transcriptional regulator
MTQTNYSLVRRCACGNIRIAARAITQFYDDILRPSGLRTTQFSMLTTIARAEQLTVTQLAETLVMDQTTVTHNLDLLRKMALIERVVGQDRRTRVLRLTPEGYAAIEKAMPLWEEAQQQAVERLGTERYRALLKDLFVLSGVN